MLSLKVDHVSIGMFVIIYWYTFSHMKIHLLQMKLMLSLKVDHVSIDMFVIIYWYTFSHMKIHLLQMKILF